MLKDFQLDSRDLPLRETLEEYSKRFPNLKNEAVEASLALLRTAANLLKAFERHLSTFSLTEGRFHVLMLLYSEPQYTLDFSVLSERAEKSKPTIHLLSWILKKRTYQKI